MADKTVATADWPSMLDFVLKLNSQGAIQFGDLRSEDIAKGSEIARLAAAADGGAGRHADEPAAVPLPLSRRPAGHV
jgi:hypothetical protein